MKYLTLRRGLLRLIAGTAAALLGSQALAQSGCTALYALTGGTTPRLTFLSNAGSLVDVSALTGTAVNGAALDPASGNLYYIDRSAGGQNDLRVFNPTTRTDTLVAAVAEPTGAVNVGGTFDNTTGTSRLFLLYNNYQVQEINKATGAVLRTLDITLPGTDTAGRTLRKTTTAVSNTTTTSGDFVFVGNTLYASLDGESTTAGAVYYVNLGVPPTTGTTGTLTGTNAVRLGNGNTNTVFAPKAVVGISINPVTGVIYVASTTTVGTLNTTTGVVTSLASSTNNYSDLADCNAAPQAPQISKAFGAASVRTGSSTTLTITLGNPNNGAYYTQAAITDTLPAGVAVAATPGVSTTCLLASGISAQSSVTATAGSGSVTLPTSIVVPQTGCTVTVNVTGTARGSKLNTIAASGADTTIGKPSSDATATLIVNDPVSATITKTQRNVTQNGTLGTTAVNARPGETVEYCLTATHAGTGYADATVATLRDAIPTPLTILTNGYGTGQGVRLKRNTGAYTYATFASDTDAATLSGRALSVNLLPFTAGTTVEACFLTQVP